MFISVALRNALPYILVISSLGGYSLTLYNYGRVVGERRAAAEYQSAFNEERRRQILETTAAFEAASEAADGLRKALSEREAQIRELTNAAQNDPLGNLQCLLPEWVRQLDAIK